MALALVAAGLAHSHAAANPVVRLETASGPIDMELFEAAAPRTVANFLAYLNSGNYNGSFFHRLVRGFVLQGGGLRWADGATPPLTAVPVLGTVVNEFAADRPNKRGTVAMAKVDGNPDSATNQWFINLADNSANLDQQNGGFTVFGRVLAPSMAVVDGFAQLQLVNASGCANVGALAGALSQVPMLAAPASCEALASGQLAQVVSARVLPALHTLAETERVFNYLEAAYPQFLKSANATTHSSQGLLYRHYPATQTYVGFMLGGLYVLGPVTQGQLLELGSLQQWVGQAQASGY